MASLGGPLWTQLVDSSNQEIATNQFLVCFLFKGAPREGQGAPGARGGPEDFKTPSSPTENLYKSILNTSWLEKFSYDPICAIKPVRETIKKAL